MTRSRLEGAMYGLLVGDALGVPYEFHAARDLPPRARLELAPPAGFAPAHAGVPPGTWSDDGAHALCLLASLLERGRLDVEDLGQRLVRWYEEGYLAVDGHVFDVGVQTRRAVGALRAGAPALEAGPSRERDNGNGSLMRVLPLALWHRGADAELVRDACLQSRVTHGHARAQVACALYCLWARSIAEGRGDADAWADATARVRACVAGEPSLVHELEEELRPDDPPGGQGTGYVVDCLRSARLAVAAGPYEVAVRAAIALGNDTDTTAAVAGGIAGLRDGIDAIPSRWLDALRGKELCAPLVDGLVARAT
ncbi:MAG TPA: ADP-ribosylglycohydrolase family protein [Anaeromyxobacter sp.]|nr:ADP-ribosylglycohydrolase family protein [Anaeromyxobacter sp.]